MGILCMYMARMRKDLRARPTRRTRSRAQTVAALSLPLSLLQPSSWLPFPHHDRRSHRRLSLMDEGQSWRLGRGEEMERGELVVVGISDVPFPTAAASTLTPDPPPSIVTLPRAAAYIHHRSDVRHPVLPPSLGARVRRRDPLRTFHLCVTFDVSSLPSSVCRPRWALSRVDREGDR